MKQTKYNFATYDGKALYLYDERPSHSPFSDILLENVSVMFLYDGLIEFTADKVMFGRTSYRSLDIEERNPDDIVEEYLVTKKELFSKKTYKCFRNTGWYELKKRKPLNIVSNNITVKYDGDE